MKALKNKKTLVLAVSAVMTLAACGGQPASSSASQPSSSAPAAKYVRADDEAVYNAVLGKFASAYDGVKAIQDNNERFVKYAKAEAELLASGVFAPTTTQGGRYAITRIAPRTVPYVFFGNDSDRIKGTVMTKGKDSFIKASERAELIKLWEKAKGGEGTYNPKAYLEGKGYEIGTEYATTTSASVSTLDTLATSKQADTEAMVNCLEGLVQYNNLGELVGCAAESWKVSEDGKTYSFKIRPGMGWFNSDKTKYADVTAQDFVDGFHHMLDADGGLDYLVAGIVKGVEEYLDGTGSFANVGCRVNAQGELEFELCQPESYFVTRLTYSCFLPMNRAFFESKGGKFGRDEFKAAKAEASYAYGKTTADVLFNGPFIPTNWDLSDTGGSIVLEKNANYWDAENVNVTKATWQYDDGKNPLAIYNAARNGTYPGITLAESSGLLKQAKDDGIYEDFHYVSDTNATTFFGGINVNRGAFEYAEAVKSTQTEEEKILTGKAKLSRNFRRALLHGWDRGTWNAVINGDELKTSNLRNMYTQPEFVSLDDDVTVDGKKYAKGTSYGGLVQSFLDAAGEKIKIDDGIDGWYNEAEAKKFMAAAREELKDIWPADKKVVIDMVNLTSNPNVNKQAAAFEQLIEKVFPNDIDVRLVEATTTAQYYYSGYYAEHGDQVNQDICYGTGWGPDYGDPSTYLDTFTDTGYMLTIIGINY